MHYHGETADTNYDTSTVSAVLDQSQWALWVVKEGHKRPPTRSFNPIYMLPLVPYMLEYDDGH